MAIKRGSKVDINGSAASMTDLMFLLLIFLMIATTLINGNALKLQLPKSSNMVQDKVIVSVSITPDLHYYVDQQEVSFDNLEATIHAKLKDVEAPIVALNSDERVPVGEVVKVMNIAKNIEKNIKKKVQINLATDPE